MDFIKRYIGGEFGLTKTYWFGYVGAGILLYLLNFLVTKLVYSSMDLQSDLVMNVLDAFVILVNLLMLICGIAVIRSSTFNRKRGVWGWIATIIVCLAFIRIIMNIISVSYGTFLTWSQLEQSVTQERLVLPITIEDGLRMTDIRADKTTRSVVMFLNEDSPYSELDLKTTSEIIHLQFIQDGVCNDIRYLKSSLIDQVTWRYTGTDNISFDVDLTKEDCGF